MAWTYILRCADDSYYVGSTWNLELRLWQHQNGLGAEYTKHRLPVELAWAGEFERIDEAFWFEKKVQGWSRAKREAVINGDWDLLPMLSKRGYRPAEHGRSRTGPSSESDHRGRGTPGG